MGLGGNGAEAAGGGERGSACGRCRSCCSPPPAQVAACHARCAAAAPQPAVLAAELSGPCCTQLCTATCRMPPLFTPPAAPPPVPSTHQVLGLLQAQPRDGADLLDDLDLGCRVEAFELEGELCLFLDGGGGGGGLGGGGGRRGAHRHAHHGHSHRHAADAQPLLQDLREVGDLQQVQPNYLVGQSQHGGVGDLPLLRLAAVVPLPGCAAGRGQQLACHSLKCAAGRARGGACRGPGRGARALQADAQHACRRKGSGSSGLRRAGAGAAGRRGEGVRARGKRRRAMAIGDGRRRRERARQRPGSKQEPCCVLCPLVQASLSLAAPETLTASVTQCTLHLRRSPCAVRQRASGAWAAAQGPLGARRREWRRRTCCSKGRLMLWTARPGGGATYDITISQQNITIFAAVVEPVAACAPVPSPVPSLQCRLHAPLQLGCLQTGQRTAITHRNRR